MEATRFRRGDSRSSRAEGAAFLYPAGIGPAASERGSRMPIEYPTRPQPFERPTPVPFERPQPPFQRSNPRF